MLRENEELALYINRCRRLRKEKKIVLFWDIETLLYNISQAKKSGKPTDYKNISFSWCVGWISDEEPNKIETTLFSTVKEFFECVASGYVTPPRYSKKGYQDMTIELIAHNNNRYDNHFLRRELMYLFPFMHEGNMYVRNAKENIYTYTQKDITPEMREGFILSKRIKSSNNLDMEIYFKGIRFKTVDNWMKTNCSIKTIGKKLHAKGFIPESMLKTEFDYQKYDRTENLSDREAFEYAKSILPKLDEKQLTYIENDVLILGYGYIYYSEIFYGFSYDAITFSKNVLDYYNDNIMAGFQLLNNFPLETDRKKQKIKYTDYQFHGMNLYDFFKQFYRGGLNFYNDKYVGKLLEESCFSMDRNSSYPDVMYHDLVPTFLSSFTHYEKPKKIVLSLYQKEKYHLFTVPKARFNLEVLYKIKSKIVRQMLTKYYNGNDEVCINTYTIRLIQEVGQLDLKELTVTSVVEYDCIPFASREHLAENYFIKTQGKLDKKIIMNTPSDYILTDEENTETYSAEEIYISKTLMNGLYGVPALRAYFNIFRLLPDGELENQINGYENTPRNILFSVWTTSVAVYKLLLPLSYLTPEEIDENFLYCDTDSLYLKSKIKDKMPEKLFDPIALGAWDIENNEITHFYILNHKKYAYYSKDIKDGQEKGIAVHCGGIPLESFNTDMPFREFIETQFHAGIVVENQKSIVNNMGTVSIYPSKTKIVAGSPYAENMSVGIDEERKSIIKEINESEIDWTDDYLYIETSVGAFSFQDLHPVIHPKHYKAPLDFLKRKHDQMKQWYQNSIGNQEIATYN